MQSNSLAGAIVSRVPDIRKESIRSSLFTMYYFEHRLEFVANIEQIEFINDSRATNINSTWWALESMTKPVIWIAGGQDAGNDYAMLKDIVKEKVKAIICLGLDNKSIKSAFSEFLDIRNEILDKNLKSKDSIIFIETKLMAEAVKFAFSIAVSGDVVLLSPACSSYDLFEDCDDRGRQFKKSVQNL